jgi:uncharacterized membrane protein
MINITSQMTQAEILNSVHNAYVIPTLIMLFSFIYIVFLLVGLIMIDSKKSGYGKFMLIWIISLLFGVVALIFFCTSPETTLSIINWLKGIYQ